MGGRPRVPTQLKVLRGTLNSTREKNRREPKLPTQIPDPPEYLRDDERQAWVRFAAILEPMKVTTAADFAALEMLATTFALRLRLNESLRESSGEVYESLNEETGALMIRCRPEVAALGDVDRRIAMLCTRFGLTPADRARVNSAASNADTSDPDDEFG